MSAYSVMECPKCKNVYYPADFAPKLCPVCAAAELADGEQWHGVALTQSDAIARLHAELKSFESLTPGGSEFADDPKAVLAWLKDRLSTMGNLAAERNQLRAELDEARRVMILVSQLYSRGGANTLRAIKAAAAWLEANKEA